MPGGVALMSRTKVQVATDLLERRAEAGVTWREVATEQPGIGHGSASRVLSDLHRTNRAVRLEEHRDGCSVYVLPEHARDREVVPYVAHRPTPDREDAAVMAARVLATIERWGLDSGSVSMCALAADLRRAINRPLPTDQPTLGEQP